MVYTSRLPYLISSVLIAGSQEEKMATDDVTKVPFGEFSFPLLALVYCREVASVFWIPSFFLWLFLAWNSKHLKKCSKRRKSWQRRNTLNVLFRIYMILSYSSHLFLPLFLQDYSPLDSHYLKSREWKGIVASWVILHGNARTLYRSSRAHYAMLICRMSKELDEAVGWAVSDIYFYTERTQSPSPLTRSLPLLFIFYDFWNDYESLCFAF